MSNRLCSAFAIRVILLTEDDDHHTVHYDALAVCDAIRVEYIKEQETDSTLLLGMLCYHHHLVTLQW